MYRLLCISPRSLYTLQNNDIGAIQKSSSRQYNTNLEHSKSYRLFVQSGARPISQPNLSSHKPHPTQATARTNHIPHVQIRNHEKSCRTGLRCDSLEYQYYRAFLRISALSVFSQGRSRSMRPKCPYAAVCL